MFRALMVFWMFLLSVGGSAKNAEPVTPPAPSLTISFERQSIRQGDCVNVELLVANNSDSEVVNTSLEVAGPSFAKWYPDSCHENTNRSESMFGAQAMPALPLGTIKARSILVRKLHLHTDKTIQVGDYNTLFIVQYQWKMNQTVASSLVTSEKAIKVNFLGSESVAGIPLALAGFIVPGLVFWLIIRLFGASWSVDALGNQMIYSVLVSIGLVFAGAWVRFLDISAGISMERLLRLVVAGLVAGVVVGGVDWGIRWIRGSRAATRAATLEANRLERQIGLRESEASLLGKLLELPAEAQDNRPLIRIAESNQQYVGALGARTLFSGPGGSGTEMIYSLVGSFSIDLSKIGDEALKARLNQLREAGQMRALVTLAEENHLLRSIEGVQRVDANGELGPSGFTFMQWKNAEVASVAADQESWEQPALR
jgi:hypothetical protein